MSYTNMLYVNMNDFLKLGKKNDAFVEVNDTGYVYKLGYHKGIEQGTVAMSGGQRKCLNISFTDKVTLTKFTKPVDQVVDLSSISFEVMLL